MTYEEQTCWRERFSDELQRHGETWADVEAVSHEDAALDARWLYGPAELTDAAPDMYLWTRTRVYSAVEIDGFGHVESVPRHPTGGPQQNWTPPPPWSEVRRRLLAAEREEEPRQP